VSAKPASRLCTVSDFVRKDGALDQIAELRDLAKKTINATTFFERNYITEAGLSSPSRLAIG
jgi:hypothetical protein